MYLAIFLIKTIFNAVYDIIKGFEIQMMIKCFLMFMVKTVILNLGMIKIR